MNRDTIPTHDKRTQDTPYLENAHILSDLRTRRFEQLPEAERQSSIAWKINRERMALLGWGTAILMQFAHPLVAAGVAEHSVATNQPNLRPYRLARTIEAFLALTFGTPEQTTRALWGINAIHRRVRGILHQDTPPFPAGAPYSAEDPALLLWVLATLLHTLPRAYELYVGPLSAGEKDRFCEEARLVMQFLGIPPDEIPTSRAALYAYMRAQYASGVITVSQQARALAQLLLYPDWPLIAQPLAWLIRLPIIGLLSPDLRAAYHLPWRQRDAVAFHCSAGLVRMILPRTPTALRYWPAARKALRTCAQEKSVITEQHAALQ